MLPCDRDGNRQRNEYMEPVPIPRAEPEDRPLRRRWNQVSEFRKPLGESPRHLDLRREWIPHHPKSHVPWRELDDGNPKLPGAGMELLGDHGEERGALRRQWQRLLDPDERRRMFSDVREHDPLRLTNDVVRPLAVLERELPTA